MSSGLFDSSVRRYIYAIYGMVRLADEIVDTYRGVDAGAQLADLRSRVEQAITERYSHNPLLHAFSDTCQKFSINNTLIDPFFESMAMDLVQKNYDKVSYEKYIYGSAEVVGLMCLKVFVANDTTLYEELKSDAQSLGSAYQKVNFLRDIRADWEDLGRWYFPDSSYDTFAETNKNQIVDEIEHDFALAASAIDRLPGGVRSAVRASYYYYHHLLRILKDTPVDELLKTRKRVPNAMKLLLLTKAKLER
jgi:phytoene/squalene synthetase